MPKAAATKDTAAKDSATPQQAPQQDFLREEAPALLVRRTLSGAFPPDPKNVLQLQRTLGNQGTLRLLQREHPLIQRDLDAERLRRALAHYEARRDNYPQFLVRRVQAALSVPITGLVDEATVQALARRQEGAEGRAPTMRSTSLSASVDGILTPEQMLDIVEVGLERRSERAAYLEDADTLSAGWGTMTPDARLSAFAANINERLTAADVPVCTVVRGTDLPSGTLARFLDPTWTIAIHPQALDAPVMGVDAMTAVYHEARHAEQSWLALVYTIQNHPSYLPDLSFPNTHPDVVAAAHDAPALAGRSAHLARMFAHWFYENSIGRGADPAFLVPLTDAYCEARRAYGAAPGAETRRALDEARRARQEGVRQYANWWHESDTHFLEGVLASEYRGAHPGRPDATPDCCPPGTPPDPGPS